MALAMTNLVVTDILVVGTNGQITGFRVDANGNITKINNVAYSFPSSQGGANSVLLNDGSGNLSWSLGIGGIKYPVRGATGITLPACTYSNGASGVGATLTGNSNGALIAQDGVTYVVNDRILVKNQSSTLQNGIYDVTQVGTAGTPFILTRSADCDSSDIVSGFTVFVSEGTENLDTGWILSTNAPIMVGTTGLIFKKFSMDPLSDLLSNSPTIPGTTYTNTYTAGNITNETWKRTSNSTNIRTADYTYSAGRLSTEVVRVYAANGVTVIAQTTRTLSYTAGALSGEVMTRDV